MYTSYKDAAETLLSCCSSVSGDNSVAIMELADRLRTDTASNLSRVDFLQPERVLRCLKGNAPDAIIKTMGVLFPRSWLFIEEMFNR